MSFGVRRRQKSLRKPLESRFHESGGQAIEIITEEGKLLGQGLVAVRPAECLLQNGITIFANHKINPAKSRTRSASKAQAANSRSVVSISQVRTAGYRYSVEPAEYFLS